MVQAKKKSITSMLSRIGKSVVCSGSQVSFELDGRSFNYNTDRSTFSEFVFGAVKSVPASEVREFVETRINAAL